MVDISAQKRFGVEAWTTKPSPSEEALDELDAVAMVRANKGSLSARVGTQYN